jgi:GTP cyclohydrolase I
MRVLSRTFSSGGYDEMIILREIEFYSCCEHHMQVFSGRASIAYVPKDRVVGVSKLARVVDIYARRLQIQERLTVQIADAIEKALEPQGVMVVLEAQHLCMRARGVKQQHSLMTTSAIRGIFRENPEVREEFLDLLKRGEGEH